MTSPLPDFSKKLIASVRVSNFVSFGVVGSVLLSSLAALASWSAFTAFWSASSFAFSRLYCWLSADVSLFVASLEIGGSSLLWPMRPLTSHTPPTITRQPLTRMAVRTSNGLLQEGNMRLSFQSRMGRPTVLLIDSAQN